MVAIGLRRRRDWSCIVGSHCVVRYVGLISSKFGSSQDLEIVDALRNLAVLGRDRQHTLGFLHLLQHYYSHLSSKTHNVILMHT